MRSTAISTPLTYLALLFSSTAAGSPIPSVGAAFAESSSVAGLPPARLPTDLGPFSDQNCRGGASVHHPASGAPRSLAHSQGRSNDLRSAPTGDPLDRPNQSASPEPQQQGHSPAHPGLR